MATNYDKYFGTPELIIQRMMRVRTHMCPLFGLIQSVSGKARCDKCKHYLSCFEATDEQREKFALEWLQEECDD